MITIDGKQYSDNVAAACYRYWKDVMDKQEVEDATHTINGYPEIEKWVDENRGSVLKALYEAIPDMNDEIEEFLGLNYKTLTDLAWGKIFNMYKESKEA